MRIYRYLQTVITNPTKLVLYLTLARFNYTNYIRLAGKLDEVQAYTRIKPQNPLEEHMLRVTNICEHLTTLYMLTKQLNLKSVLELGVGTGESTIAFLSAAKEIGGEELQKFEPYVNGGVITLHDIVLFPSVLQAIEDYLSNRKDLKLYKYFNNNGLAVIFKRRN